MSAKIVMDHLAVACLHLEEGRAAVEDALGVALQPGGQHAYFATHNLLLGLEEGLYLEVIACDPSAQPPDYPRWFDLDRFKGTPRLTNWICRTDDLAGAVRAWPGAGRPVALSRGDLQWEMAVPGNGILPFDNRFPALIQWHCATHPAQSLAPSGCRLTELCIRHPEAEALQQALSGALGDGRVRFETGESGMQAVIDTPHGPRVLE